MQAVFSHRKRVVMALDESQTWHVAYTKPRQERIALENLERQDFEAYLPMFKVFKKPRRGAASPQGQGMLAYEPMFPRYIFFRATRPEQSLGTLRSTRGVASVVRFGIEFADVSCELLQAIREVEQRRDQAAIGDISPLQPGSRVRLSEPSLGGLAGWGQEVSSKVVIVLLAVVGKIGREAWRER